MHVSANQVSRVSQASREDQVLQDCLALRDLKVLWARRAPVDPLDLLGEKAKMDLKVPQVPKDQRDLQVLKEHKETKVKQVKKEAKDL